MSSIIDDYVTVPRSMVRSTEVANFKEIKGAPETDKKKTPQVSPSSSAAVSEASSSSITTCSAASNSVPSRSDVKELKILKQVSGFGQRGATMVRSKGRGKASKMIQGDDAISAPLTLVASGTWANTAVSTVYGGLMTPNGCSEFTEYKKLYEQYRVQRIVAEFWTGDISMPRAVSGTSVCTGVPVLCAWANIPVPIAPSFALLSDMNGARMIDYTMKKSLHILKHVPHGCYIDVGSSTYENSVGWQSTSVASDHVWGTFLFSSNGQIVTAGGLTYTIIYKFDVEFRRRRYTA
jgi:hypothetical protein